MDRETRNAKYKNLREEIQQSIILEQNASQEASKVAKYKDILNNVDDDFFKTGQEKVDFDEEIKKRMSHSREFGEIQDVESNHVKEKVTIEKTDIISKLSLELEAVNFNNEREKNIVQKIQSSREIELIMLDISKSSDILDYSIKKNNIDLKVKLVELEKMKEAKTYSKKEMEEAKKSILSFRNRIIEQTDEYRMQIKKGSDFEDYSTVKKMDGIKKSISESNAQKWNIFLAVIISLALGAIIMIILRGYL